MRMSEANVEALLDGQDVNGGEGVKDPALSLIHICAHTVQVAKRAHLTALPIDAGSGILFLISFNAESNSPFAIRPT